MYYTVLIWFVECLIFNLFLYLCAINHKEIIMKIGIIVAMNKEFRRIATLLDKPKEAQVHNRSFVTGRIGDNDFVLSECGIGKVNAAIGATELINGFAPDVVVSTGVAGGASTSLNVQDVVVSTASCYHDVYCGEDVEYGQIPSLPPHFTTEKRFVDIALGIKGSTRVVPGLIVTGDWFVDSREKMQAIVDKFPDAMAVDMETAAIAHTCFLRHTPFVSFRIISDIPMKDSKASQYFDFWDRLADCSFNVTKSFLEKI